MHTNEDSQLYIHLTYQEKVYYIADSAITGNYTYWPFLVESPAISYGGEGYLKVSSGTISILKDYDGNTYHPFMGSRYLDLLTKVQEIPFEIYMGKDLVPLYAGTLALESVTENALNFSILEEEFEECMCHPVLDETRVESKNIVFIKKDNEIYPVVEMYDNPFSDGQEIIFESISSITGKNCDKLTYEKKRNNRYIVTDRTTSFFRMFDEDEPDLLITIDNLGLVEADFQQASDTTYSDIKNQFGLAANSIFKLTADQIYNVGSPVMLPFSFGNLTIRNPVIRYGDKQLSDGSFVYLLKNPSIDYTDTDFHLYDGGVEVTENLVAAESDSEHIALLRMPVDEVAISGPSLNGQTIAEFYRLVCSYLNGSYLSKTDEIDMENLDAEPDFTFAPNAVSTNISLFMSSEATMLETASEVAETTNYFFYFEPYTDSNGDYRRRMKVIDLNEVLFNQDAYPINKEISEDNQISIDINYPYPVRSLEATIDVNKLYQGIAEEERARSQMRNMSLTFRVDVSSVGNIETKNVFAQSVAEGKIWLNRFQKTVLLPEINAQLKDIHRDISLGSKLRVFDFVKNYMADLIVTEVSYDFASRKTVVKGKSIIKEVERY